MTNLIIAQHLIGESAPMRHLRSLISRVAVSTLPVLVEGETGAGKELVARALHQSSGRRGALIAFNVCAIADTMFEDALFGHVRGAYTGAVQNSAGYLAEANGGTLFLDEIGGLPLASQAKLLRAIETKEFRPVGASHDRRSEFRVTAASNEPIEELVRSGRFRSDLAQRLGGIRLEVPPLRARVDDVPLLVRHFASALGMRVQPAFSAGAMRRLQAYDWPGNVRQLRYVIEAAVTLATGPHVTGDDIDALTPRGGRATWSEFGIEARDAALIALLEQSAWDVSVAARELGVHRATIYRHLSRLKRLGRVSPSIASEMTVENEVEISRAAGA